MGWVELWSEGGELMMKGYTLTSATQTPIRHAAPLDPRHARVFKGQEGE
jgi:hypothetical protein